MILINKMSVSAVTNMRLTLGWIQTMVWYMLEKKVSKWTLLTTDVYVKTLCDASFNLYI